MTSKTERVGRNGLAPFELAAVLEADGAVEAGHVYLRDSPTVGGEGRPVLSS